MFNDVTLIINSLALINYLCIEEKSIVRLSVEDHIKVED